MGANVVCCACGVVIQDAHGNRRYCVACANDRPKRTGATNAIAAVSRAVKRGDMPAASELACVDCGKGAQHYDHRDYSQPLVVEPVCTSCNWHRGPAKYLASYRQHSAAPSLAERKAAKRCATTEAP